MPDLDVQIAASVGRWSKGAVNQKADVQTVQEMLRSASMILHETNLDPNAVDGSISHNEQKSDTVKAIESLQRRFAAAPDGLIEVGKRTWRELVQILEGSDSDTSPTVPTPDQGVPAPGEFFFPFTRVPEVNWTEGMRRFGADRSHRAHAACDLYFPTGTTIHAITSGRVVRGPYAFYQGTFALEIDHGTFLARYGEIQENAIVHNGDQVSPGQAIAKVGNLTGITASMLHLELYDKTASGGLTVPAAQSAKRADGRPFMRRRDLMDPTSRLNEWKNHLPS